MLCPTVIVFLCQNGFPPILNSVTEERSKLEERAKNEVIREEQGVTTVVDIIGIAFTFVLEPCR